MAANPKIHDWRGLRVWLVGASAGIGEGLAHALDTQGAQLILSARDRQALETVASSLSSPPCVLPLDVTDGDQVQAAWDAILSRFSGVDLVVYLAGTYQPLDATAPASQVLEIARRTVAVNFLGAMEVASRVAPYLASTAREKTRGIARGIVLVGSVAGYRGLPKALAYSPSKAALIAYAECLHHDLAPRGVGVWIVNPGFVRTRLTAQNEFSMPALISVDAAVAALLSGMRSGRFEIHFPKRFSRVLKVLRWLPDAAYFALMRRLAPPA